MSETEDNDEWVPATPVLEESVEPLRPLVQEARWTSSLVAEQLLADSEAFYAEWSPLHAHPPYAVYHYTDTSGLKGILESGHLRALDVAYLDGSREIGYTYGLFREHLRKRWRSNDQLVGDFCLQAELALDPKRWSRNLFVACFAENGDALTQWRTHGTDGAYAIGLRTGVLESVGVRLQRSELRRVIYSAEHQNALLQHMLDRAINVVRAAHVLPEQERAGVIAVVVEFLSDHFIELVASFKRPHLQEELEWRLGDRAGSDLCGRAHVASAICRRATAIRCRSSIWISRRAAVRRLRLLPKWYAGRSIAASSPRARSSCC
jgi:hypothetical protein